jgi:hypothetical protein
MQYAHLLVNRYGSNIYAFSSGGISLDHVLRFAFPRMVDYPSTVASVDVLTPDSVAVTPSLAEPLGTIAHREFNDRLPKVLIKTIARALIKEFARTRAKKSSDALGALVNIANFATERADTRSWLFLPDQISLAKFSLSPGPHDLVVIFYDGHGLPVDRKIVSVDVPADGMTFERVRSYR